MNDDLLSLIARLRSQNGRAALATIVGTAGSTPGKEAMKLLVKSDGTFAGTVGGGCLEAEVYEAAMDVIAGGAPQLLQFKLNERDYPDSGLLCGGMVSVFVESIDEPGEFFVKMLELRDAGVALARAAVIGRAPAGLGRSRVIGRDGSDFGDLRGPGVDEFIQLAADEVMRTDRPKRVRIAPEGVEAFEVFVESVSLPTILVFGGGHVSGAIAKIAAAADFRVVILDDREMFANPARHPDAAQTIVTNWEDAVARFAPARDARCVVVTRGHKDDERVLLEMARRSCEPVYLGMIGSRTKQILVLNNLRAAGVSESFISRIKTPIGLDIGARSHAEIAVSVVAELIKLRRKGEL